jgi:hypothetical protein
MFHPKGGLWGGGGDHHRQRGRALQTTLWELDKNSAERKTSNWTHTDKKKKRPLSTKFQSERVLVCTANGEGRGDTALNSSPTPERRRKRDV